jgi:hypothetical protein
MDIQLHPLIELSIWAAFLLGGFICLTNFSLPVRYYLKVWRKQPPGPNVSPIPIFGSLAVYLTLEALASAPLVTMLGASLLVKVVGIVLIAIDMGGIHWMIFGIGMAVFREIRQRLRGTGIDPEGPGMNPAAAIIFVLLVLAVLLKAIA